MGEFYSKIREICTNWGNKIAYTQFESDRSINISYLQFLEFVEKLIVKLKDLELPKRAVIGVNLTRSYQVSAYIVACSALDYIYVPLDTEYPDEYIDSVSNQLNINLLVQEDSTIVLNKNENSISEDCRFIYFTSGSTGVPKGVMHGEKHLLERINWMCSIYPFSEEEIMGQRAYISTIPSEWDLFGAFFSGNTTVFIPNTVMQDINTFSNFIDEHKITRLTLNPTILRFWIKYKISDKVLKSLKYVISLGEKLDNALINLIIKKYSFILLDDYGSTETSTLIITEYIKNRKSCIRKAPYYKLMIKNQELIVKGENLFIGYTGDKETKLHRKYYKTGDIVVERDGGKIEIEGRKDDIVKISGKRVNTKLVERYLKEIYKNQELAVVTVKSHGELELHAVLVTNSEEDNFVEIRRKLTKKIPSYMVPTSFHIVSELPKLPNDKIDYKSLSKQLAADDNKLVTQENFLNSAKNIIGEVIGKRIEGKLLDSKFIDIGMDSTRIMEAVGRLKMKLNSDIQASDFYNFETPRKLLEKMTSDSTFEQVGETDRKAVTDDIVIVGVSGRFAEYSNIEELYSGLVEGKTSFYEDNRLGLEKIYSNKHTILESTYVKRGGFLSTWNRFQNSVFEMTTREAELMDPQQRFLLMETENLFRQDGFKRGSLFDNNIGVFIGADESGFRNCIKRDYRNSPDAILGNLTALIANRISYYYNLSGPSLMINTACSSSLVAVIEAMESIKQGECNLALAGGVSIQMSKDYFIDTSRLNIFSDTEKQCTFSDKADGFLSGEGGAVILLTKESYALENDLTVLARLNGAFSNQDGSSNGITAPNGQAQVSLLNNVLKQSALGVDDITAVECHGTGTHLGDLVELNALDTVFKDRKESLVIGSLKSNIGHLNAAAGIASLVKGLLCLIKQKLFVTPNAYPLNSLFNWKDSSLIVPRNLQCLQERSPRIMINSFGIGGTNATCILEGVGTSLVSFENNLDLGDNMSVEFLDLGGNLSKIAQERATSERKVEAPNIRQKFMELLERELNISQNDIDFSKSLKDITDSSLKIMNIRFMIKEKFNKDISLKQLFSNQSIKSLESLLIINDTENNVESSLKSDDIDNMSDEQVIDLFKGVENE